MFALIRDCASAAQYEREPGNVSLESMRTGNSWKQNAIRSLGPPRPGPAPGVARRPAAPRQGCRC